VKNQTQIEFYTADHDVWDSWKAILSQRTILTTFHEDFLVRKKLGEGNFATVYLAI
jgi:hypothetical protein